MMKRNKEKARNEEKDSLNYFNDDSTEYDEGFTSTNNRQRRLDVKKYDRMVKDVVEALNNGDIILNPEYQRCYLWDNKKASKLIESILLNIPIPIIYASENSNSKWVIVDGLQRLYSLKRFYNNEYKLRGLEVLTEFNGKNYNELEQNTKNRIDNGDLTIILLLSSSSQDIQYDIFMRLNRGSVKLNEQELRNCLYRGKLNDYIKNELTQNQYFKKIFSFKNISKRMLDVETILRYLSFSESLNRKTLKLDYYDGRIKNLINNYMNKHQNENNNYLSSIGEKFNKSIKKCYEIYGDNAFRLSNDKKNRINRPLYETIMICFEEYDENVLIENKERIIKMTNELLVDSYFNDLITKSTGNTIKVSGRIVCFKKKLKEAIDDK